ncbi:pilus assembly FimT family protein [Thermotalea metallivorans]|uniref:Prepilin-type N-terminal cleavage/methylation domain-containing protein n=1 Tax=Thermotalea metallivorans TaxID=520762 RepID=A0A140L8B0_9FIRM|nr:prepilin-type N-terminal cleavage/methylation domain-containing protein [Thermotalea metallivorans]KXG76785.1 hypothetical protein AN619_07770 [Thermotalea metallivorans]
MNNKGFTFIEIIIVSAFIALLFSIAISKGDYSNYHLRIQSQQLCADIRNIRILKMTEGGLYNILLSNDHYKVLNGSKILKTVQLLSQHELLYGKNEIIFSYQGVPVHGGDTIRVRNKKNNRYMEITIVPASGRVLLKDEIYSP